MSHIPRVLTLDAALARAQQEWFVARGNLSSDGVTRSSRDGCSLERILFDMSARPGLRDACHSSAAPRAQHPPPSPAIMKGNRYLRATPQLKRPTKPCGLSGGRHHRRGGKIVSHAGGPWVSTQEAPPSNHCTGFKASVSRPLGATASASDGDIRSPQPLFPSPGFSVRAGRPVPLLSSRAVGRKFDFDTDRAAPTRKRVGMDTAPKQGRKSRRKFEYRRIKSGRETSGTPPPLEESHTTPPTLTKQTTVVSSQQVGGGSLAPASQQASLAVERERAATAPLRLPQTQLTGTRDARSSLSIRKRRTPSKVEVGAVMISLVDKFGALASPKGTTSGNVPNNSGSVKRSKIAAMAPLSLASPSPGVGGAAVSDSSTEPVHFPASPLSTSAPASSFGCRSISKGSRMLRRRRKCGLSLNMQIIEDDMTRGTLPAPAGDSTRNKQASCDRACSRVLDFLFVGGARVAKDEHMLRVSGVTHVLNCAGQSCPDHFPGKFSYRTLELRDTGKDDIAPYLVAALAFIESARNSGGKIFVHCVKGISRSPAIAIAYLMWHQGLSLDEAHSRLKLARPVSDPNAGFIFQLREWVATRPKLVLQGDRAAVFRILGAPQHVIRDTSRAGVSTVAASEGPLSHFEIQMFDPKANHLYLVFIPGCTFLWRVPSCSDVRLRMARAALRSFSIVEPISSTVQEVLAGQEPTSFWAAVAQASWGDGQIGPEILARAANQQGAPGGMEVVSASE